MFKWIWWQWFKFRTRKIIDWSPPSESDLRRTDELAARFGWGAR